MEQCNVQHAIDGLKAVEGFLSTTADLTKQMKPSFALPPLLGGHMAVKRQQNRRKEGCVCIHARVCACAIMFMQCVCVHINYMHDLLSYKTIKLSYAKGVLTFDEAN